MMNDDENKAQPSLKFCNNIGISEGKEKKCMLCSIAELGSVEPASWREGWSLLMSDDYYVVYYYGTR